MGRVVLTLLLAACGGGGPVPAPAPIPVREPTPPPVAVRPRRVLPATPIHYGPRDTAVTLADLDSLWQQQLMLPVEGLTRKALKDNYTAGRGAERIHGALDIAAPRSTPVLAAGDLIIGRLSTGPVGGIVIYAYDPAEQFTYYFAHLERYRRGLAVGDRVAKGSVIGYVGTTGNAPKNAPHLHFQVMKRGTGRAWWDGPPINPFSYFAADGIRPTGRDIPIEDL
jgi:murein DD-endopeptidase MepM/ murein hydrolase activator NlpD